MERARIDRWVWAVRLYKTRSAATEACRAGHVRINGVRAKPSADVSVGDTVRALTPGGERIVEVRTLLAARAGAAVAVTCYVDHTPAPPPREERVPVAQRDPGSGRPSKRERRALDRARGRRG